MALSLYYAASIGLPNIVNIYLQYNVDVNTYGGRYGNMLQTVLYTDYERVVQILLGAEAEVNT